MRKVLILGKSARVSALAFYLSKFAKVYVAPGDVSMESFATIANIENFSTGDIAEFVAEHDISLTLVTDNALISKDFIEKFQDNGLPLFALNHRFFDLLKDKVAVKKFLYKHHILTPRFASFDKASIAYDYVRNANMPLIIKSNLGEYATICVSENIAKTAIDDLVVRDEQMLIEEYLGGITFSVYFITDGYKALPIGSAQNYNFALEGDGGVLTNGIGSCAPFYKLSDAHLAFMTTDVATPIIESFERQGEPIIGIFGVEAILTPDDRIYVTNLKPFISDADAQGILELLDIDLLKLIDDCLMGTFADIYEFIPQKESYALSAVLSSRNDGEIIDGLNNLCEDTKVAFYSVKKNKYLEYTTTSGKVINVTVCAGTISRARDMLYNEIAEISFNTKSYRKDIGALLAGNRGLI